PNPKLEQLRAMADAVRTGGKGSVRRKIKAVHKITQDDEKLVEQFIQSNNLRNIPSIDQIEMVRSDNNAMVFNSPKVHMNRQANTTVIKGKYELKPCTKDVLPQDRLRELQELLRQAPEGAKLPNNIPGMNLVEEIDDDEDDKKKKKQNNKKEENKKEQPNKKKGKKEKTETQPDKSEVPIKQVEGDENKVD
ncbi:MAG: hypothetical protein EZS28_023174, partial [Streblomastix strix]